MPGAQFMVRLGGTSAVTRTFLDHKHSTSSGTFAGVNFGSNPNAGRVLVACVQTNAATALTGVTIGGVAATQFVITAGTFAAIYGAVVPTGTSGTVVISTTGGTSRWGLQLYELAGLITLAASDTGTSTAGDPTDTLNVPVGGVLIGTAFEIAGTSTTCTWSGVTGDATDTDALTVYSSGSIEVPAGNAALTITADFDAAPSTSRGAFASFGP